MTAPQRLLLAPALALAAAVALGPASARAGRTDHLFALEGKATPESLSPGEKGSARLAIKVKPEGHISDEAPLKATLVARNLKVEKEKLAKADAVYKDGGASFTVPFTAGPDKGEAFVEADLVFFICSKEICERHQRKLKVPLTVK